MLQTPDGPSPLSPRMACVGLLLGLSGCCPPLCITQNPCNEPVKYSTHADEVFGSVRQLNVHAELPENIDNYFWLYMRGGTLSADEDLAQGVAYRARLVDGQDADVFQRASILILSFVLAYEFPSKGCDVDLHWEVNPSVYLPHGLAVESFNSNSEPFVAFELAIVEDPSGQYTASTLPDWVVADNVVADATFTSSFENGHSVFDGVYQGDVRVSANTSSKLFVRLGVVLAAQRARDRACIGCNLSDASPNDLIESAWFSIGSGGNRGPLWYMERAQ